MQPASSPPSGLRGKKRSFGRGLLLTIVTLGLYALYWHFKAFKELYDQEGRTDFPIGLYVCYFIPLVGPFIGIVYMSKQLELLNGVRARMGKPPTLTLGAFLAWYILGSFIIVGPFVAYYKVQTAINEVWDGYATVRLQPGAPASPQPRLA